MTSMHGQLQYGDFFDTDASLSLPPFSPAAGGDPQWVAETPCDPSPGLRRTPLHALHRALGARMVAFAGYEMPVHYATGVLKEHLHTRAQAGLFDVSHMGQIRVGGADAAAALERLMPVDVVDLPVGRQRYAMLTGADGGILDDLMIANAGDHLLLVVNAARKAQDLAHLRARIGHECTIEPLFDARALLALQGPAAAAALARLAPEVAAMRFMQFARVTLLGADCLVSRSGYSGEDGYEISVPAEHAEALARRLLDEPEVLPAGLGARDSLRLEAGLCLYGHDMDGNTTPVEASLGWAISRVRRSDGVRNGGFPGAARIYGQQRHGVLRRRVGLRVLGRTPIREGTALFDAEGNRIGEVTSGSFGPTLGAPVAMGYLHKAYLKPGTRVLARVRGEQVPVAVTETPFVPHRYHRG